MPSFAIHAEHLGKRYRLRPGGESGRYQRFSEVLTRAASHLFRPSPKFSEPGGTSDFWALQDVSFQIEAGESVGILGRNGAGKSTLLKILSRITEPTTGRVSWRGRAVSLLEVGTGFHPELTGRENIYLNGAILGLSRAEIRARLDPIIAFAEVERFVDTPVKRYSSGMYVRLAFAVAAHVQPDILILDEVLAVGDAAFQRKCFNRIHDLATAQQTTVLMISHNLQALMRLCQRGLLLHEGRLIADGPIDTVVQEYHRRFAESRLSFDCAHLPRAGHLHAQVLIERVSIEGDEAGVPFGAPLRIQLVIASHGETTGLTLAWALFSAHGDEVASARLAVPTLPSQRTALDLCVPHLRLAPGRFTVNFGLGSDHGDEDFVNQGLVFDVLPNELAAAAWTDTIRAATVPETEITSMEAA